MTRWERSSSIWPTAFLLPRAPAGCSICAGRWSRYRAPRRSRSRPQRDPMPRGATFLSVATAVPGHVLTSDQVKEHYPKAFNLDPRRLEVMLNVVDNAQIRQRHMLFPLEYTIEPRSL